MRSVDGLAGHSLADDPVLRRDGDRRQLHGDLR